MKKSKTVTILGATGSVGQSTLDLILRTPDKFAVEALTAHSDVEGLAKAARATSAKFAVIGDPSRFDDLKDALSGTGIEVGAGEDAVIEAALRNADWTMAAIVGCAGLMPVMAALEGGKTLAFANKEALVSAGSLMIDAATRSGATLLPVDSEHNAIFQCLDQSAPKGVHRIVLTASGGPFRTTPLEEMARATPAQAVAHPNWSMGAKISVDSATMMNKGLELIEAHHLFAMPADRLDVVIHPQSVVHSMVEYADGSVLAQLGPADMRVPIAHTLAWPERMDTPCERLDLAAVGRLDFMAPDYLRFPALKLAREVMIAGGPAPAIMNAANEAAVAAFLAGTIAFGDIATVVARVLDRYVPADPISLADVLAIDSEARRVASALMESVVA
ncbi:1-deoxy-D-xylulose-5-phosphate reductoisomerase [Aquisediminimonas profunda]|uniref:1-deoxy-D-xylulose-5-phosphate reductoisomerase n=1 Tax=Aquisediminimonas profunda TaxID=1550733 RepID=UPI001C6355E1|nr:1-deoxy-D-xylulose-5-phosphate reductoisomerase [Aquisediminimonas profunda]